jgi:hypothetical protein
MTTNAIGSASMTDLDSARCYIKETLVYEFTIYTNSPKPDIAIMLVL